MPVVLGSYTFDADRTSSVERHEEIGGRDARVVEIRGVLDGLASAALVQAALDAILASASAGDAAALSLRAGRRLWVKRKSFEQVLAADGASASFVLTLEAENPYEESETESVVVWGVPASGAQCPLQSQGTADTPLCVSLTAVGTVLEPVFSDGVRTMTYAGTVSNGKVLVLDGVLGVAWLDGVDVTAYTVGEFPRVAPGGSTLTYGDAAASSHQASVTVSYRERWW